MEDLLRVLFGDENPDKGDKKDLKEDEFINRSLEVVSQISGVPLEKLKLDFNEFLDDKNNGYHLTLFDMAHELKENQYALSKNQELKIFKNERDQFVDEEGEMIPLTIALFRDVYMIKENSSKTLKSLSMNAALEAFEHGKEIELHHEDNVYHYKKEALESDESPKVALGAAIEGSWFLVV